MCFLDTNGYINIVSYKNDENKVNVEIDNTLQVFDCPILGKSYYSRMIVTLTDTENGDIVIELCKYMHPQIINGINVQMGYVSNTVKGILNDEIHPKNYCIKSVNDIKTLNIKNNNPYKKDIKEIVVNTFENNKNDLITYRKL